MARKMSPRLGIILAFAAIYMIWGSTYLAIRYAIDTVPPFAMAAMRFLLAGAILYPLARASGIPRPTGINWRGAAIVGGLLLLGGNGGVVWAEKRVPSSLAALLVAMVPLWMALLDWIRPGGVRPRARVFMGLFLGLTGIVLLVGPGEIAGGSQIDPIGALALMVSTFCWASGSIYSRYARLASSGLLATGMEMLAGGALLLVASVATGEWLRFDVTHVSLGSWAALLYLVVFGSLVAFSAYVWLLKVAAPARVSTYAYVNPVVAVFLGWWLASEPVTPRTLIAAAVIIGAVALITSARSKGAAAAVEEIVTANENMEAA